MNKFIASNSSQEDIDHVHEYEQMNRQLDDENKRIQSRFPLIMDNKHIQYLKEQTASTDAGTAKCRYKFYLDCLHQYLNQNKVNFSRQNFLLKFFKEYYTQFDEKLWHEYDVFDEIIGFGFGI